MHSSKVFPIGQSKQENSSSRVNSLNATKRTASLMSDDSIDVKNIKDRRESALEVAMKSCLQVWVLLRHFNLRKIVKSLMHQHQWFFVILDVANTFLSLLSCALYIVQSYFEEEPGKQNVIESIDDVEVVITFVFLFDYALNVTVAPNRMRYIISFPALVDLITIVPPFIVWSLSTAAQGNESVVDQQGLETVSKLNFLRFVRVLKVLRILRLRRLLDQSDSEVQRQLFTVTLTVLSIIFCFAGLFQVVEMSITTEEERLKAWKFGHLFFHDAIYFTLVTVATLGYGDIIPISIPGKFLVMTMIAVTIAIISQQINKLIYLLASQSTYARARFKSHMHVVITGSVNVSNVRDFTDEFLHPDHGAQDVQIVVLHPDEPSSAMEYLLGQPSLSYRCHFIKGSAMVEKDLRRAGAHKASCVFVFNHISPKSKAQADAETMLRAMAISRFVNHMSGRKRRMVIQLHSRTNKRRYLASAGNEAARHTIICLDELQAGLFAKSCQCPGFTTLIHNLMQSVSDDGIAQENVPKSFAWLSEYTRCAGYELYRTKLSPVFAGWAFSNVSLALYKELQVTVFAMEIMDDGVPAVRLAPPNYRIPRENTYVYVLAEDRQDADKVSNYGGGTLSNSLSQLKSKSSSFIRSATNMSLNKMPSFGSQQREVRSKSKVSGLWGKVRMAVTVVAGFTKREADSGEVPINEMAQLPDFVLQSELNPSLRRRELQPHFYVMGKDLPLHSATVHGFDGVGHVIVCGSGQDLFSFVSPLRSKQLRKIQPIVVLSSSISEAEWATISIFEEVYVVHGRMTQPRDLLRAGLANASRVVVMAADKATGPALAEGHEDEGIKHDAEPIFAYQMITKLNPRCSVVVGVSEVSSLSMMRATKGANTLQYNMLPHFAAGQTMVGALYTLVSCQCFFNTYTITAIEELVRSRKTVEKSTNSIQGSSVFQIQIPEGFVGKKYIELFEFLAKKRQSVPLGIYRAAVTDQHTGPLRADQYFTLANGSADLTLTHQDRVFVVAPTQPSEAAADYAAVQSDSSREVSMFKSTSEVFVDLLSTLTTETKSLRQKIDKVKNYSSSHLQALNDQVSALESGLQHSQTEALSSRASQQEE